MEFYADFVRIVGKRGAINRDIPYRDLDVGPLFEVRRQRYNHFRISARGVSKPLWEVINKRIASIDTFVYTLIEERKRGEPI